MESDGYILVGRLIEICLVEEMTEMGEIHKKDDTGVETHGVSATVLSKIAFFLERKVKITRDLPVPGQHINRTEAWE